MRRQEFYALQTREVTQLPNWLCQVESDPWQKCFGRALSVAGKTSMTSTLGTIPQYKRAQIARDIAARHNWDELGLLFENEIKTTYSRNALQGIFGENLSPKRLCEHLIEKLVGHNLSIGSFVRALDELGMKDIVSKYPELQININNGSATTTKVSSDPPVPITLPKDTAKNSGNTLKYSFIPVFFLVVAIGVWFVVPHDQSKIHQNYTPNVSGSKLETLRDISDFKRAQIASKIAENRNWPLLGLSFRQELGIVLKKDSLVAKYGNLSDEQLCHYLIEEFANRALSIQSFRNALQSSNIGMHYVVQEFPELQK